jgi:hypothetical protein
MPLPHSDDELRVRYLDWCSSQVARRFLELSEDEVWMRSRIAASQSSSSPDLHPTAGTSLLALERIPGYLDLVRRTALVLAQEMELPTFEEWKPRYLADPAAYQREMLGG